MLTPEDELISAELAKKLSQAIRELPSQCRIIFQLVKEDGLKYKEVASILDISVLTVRNQVAIALKKLEAALPSLQYKSVIKAEKFSDS
jgi:RNA polymerase sigma-70 factor (ECF subfamily)